MSITRSNPTQVQGYTSSYSQNPKLISTRWKQISVGAGHTLAINYDNKLFAWGNNTSGQLGNNSGVASVDSPIQIGSNNWSSIVASLDYSMAIDSSGNLYAWGNNASGQLGLNDTVSRSSPAVLSGSSWYSISTTGTHTLAIRSDRTLWAWGDNRFGQLGTVDYITSYSSPVQIGSSSWSQISAGQSYSTGLTVDGKLFTWGDNTNGRLGYADPLTINYSWNMIAGNDDFTLAIRQDGLLFAWGLNTTGQLGLNDTVYRSSPVQVGTYSWKYVNVNSGGAGAVATAIRNDNTLWGWGLNNVGQVGDGTIISRSSPVQVSLGGSWSSVSSGKSHKLAINSAGELYAWGLGTSGQLGIVPEWKQLAQGNGFTIGIKTDGSMWAWGLGTTGQLGNGALINRSAPVQIGSSSWAQVAAGGSQALAIDASGFLYTWGGNSQGELGDGTTVTKSSPVKIGSSSWSQVAAFIYQSSAITSDGRLFSWGYNNNYTIGDGTSVARSSPVQVSGTGSWTMTAQGSGAAYGIKSDGSLWAWGFQGSGELGDGVTTSTWKSVPAQVGTNSWIMVTAGLTYALGITIDNKLYGWGLNTSNQLGDGTGTTYSVPTLINSSSWTIVAASTDSTGAITSDGKLYTWGKNNLGQLGDGTTVDKGTPTQILPGTSFTLLAGAKNNNTTNLLAISNKNHLWAWGQNGSGQLGDGTTTNKSNPVQLQAANSTSTPTKILPGVSFTNASVNDSASYAIDSTNKLWAMGLNTSGQLGDGTVVSRSSPVQIGTSNWTSVYATGTWVHGITSDNRLHAWGLGTTGQLGYNDILSRSSPVQISASKFTQVAGYSTTINTLALDTTGSLWAWGAKSNKLLNEFSNASYSYSWTTISTGLSHTVAVRNDGRLYTWGLNSTGQLGDNTTVNKSSPTLIGGTGGIGEFWLTAAAGGNRTYAIRNDNTLWAWGSNLNYALAVGDTVNRSSPVQVLSSIPSWAIISAGLSHTLALTPANMLYGWGDNTYGQLGTGDTVIKSSPVQIGSKSWTTISAGGSHSTAIDSSSKLFVWGANDSGQLGVNDTINRSSPIQVGAKSWIVISAGDKHTMTIDSSFNMYGFGNNQNFQVGATDVSNIIKPNNNGVGVIKVNDSSLWAWGSNDVGQLGITSIINRSSPVQVGTVESFVTVARAQTATAGHTLAIRNNGTLWAWGSGVAGKLGLSDTLNRSSPVQVGTSSWSQVATGTSHSLAIKNDGTLWGWGLNTSGQAGMLSWTSTSVGISHTLALRNDGAIFAWGSNTAGQLGDNTTLSRSSPVQIGAGNIFTKVNAGYNYSAAIRNDGTLWTWGTNTAGALGLTDTINRSSPVQVGANQWADISGQWSTVAGVRSTGEVYVWGNNDSGQLGQSDTINRSSPVQIGAGSSWISAKAGNTVFLIRNDNVAFASGWNTSGQIGDNTNANKSSPVQIAGSWSAINSGYRHTLGIKTDGTLWSWGANDYGQLGINNTDYQFRSNPTQLPVSGSWKNVYAAMDYSIAVTTSDLVYVWGANTYGRLGVVKSFTWVSGQPTGGIHNDGSLWTWGVNLGTGISDSSLLPKQMDNNSWTQLITNNGVRFGIRTDNTLYAWGDNGIGQLGDGTTVSKLSPVQIQGSWSTLAISVTGTALAIKTDGTLWSWGRNDNGELGDPTMVPYTTARSSPIQVGTGTWLSTSTNGNMGYAIKSDGTLWSWGNNWAGQLGLTPTYSWTQITGGTEFKAAIRNDGLMFLWGNNTKGQLGLGDTISRSSPVQVGTGVNILNGGAYYDGLQSYHSTPASANLGLAAGDFTVELWFNMRMKTHLYPALIGNYTTYTTNSWGLFVDRSDTAASRLYFGSFSGASVFAADTYIEKNRWYHVAVSRSGSTLTIWINGVLAGTSNIGTTNIDAGATTTIYIGRTDTGTPFNGFISNVRIVKGTSLYNAPFTPSTSPLTAVAGTQLLTMQNVYAKDNSANNFTITPVSGAFIGPGITPFIFTNYDTFGYRWNTVSAGNSHISAIASDGTVWVWGDNTNGQLGTNDTVSRSLPVQINSSYNNIIANGNNTWFTTDNSAGGTYPGRVTIYGVGSNSTGQLGINTTTDRSSPVQVGTDYRSIRPGLTGHTLATKYDYTLWAWGNNANNELGLYDIKGTPTNYSSPVQVGTSSWSQVSAGTSFSLGIGTDNKLYGWGSNVNGQVGIPNPVTFTSLKQNAWITSDGKLYVYGDNTYGQLGLNLAFVNRSAPVQLGSDRWKSVGNGFYSMFGVKGDGTLWGWGQSTYAWFDNGATTIARSSPTQIGARTDWSYVDINATNETVYALTTSNDLYAFGKNTSGQLGQGDTVTRSSPVQVSGKWLSVAVGWTHILGIQTDGTLWAWGDNSVGQLGNSTFVSRSTPIQVGTSSWTQIAAGSSFSMALKADGSMWLWGTASGGTLGDNTNSSQRNSPAQLGTSSWTQVAALTSAAAAIDTAGRLFTWGYNLYGQLGSGTTLSRSSPVQVGTSSWSALQSGNGYLQHAAISLAAGPSLFGWGAQPVGDNTTLFRSSPVQIASYTGSIAMYISPVLIGTSSWTQVNAGSGYGSAIRADGGLFTWGLNTNGVLGIGDTLNRSSPVQIGTSSWTQVSGIGAPIAVKVGYGLFTWGLNTSGQIGDNTTVAKSSPVGLGTVATGIPAGFQGGILSPTQVGTSSWKQVATGDIHALLIRSDNTLWGTGSNINGQLGITSTVYRSIPVQVGTGLSWSQITAGWQTSAGVMSNGTLMAWGNNSFGQLGSQATLSRSAPTQITGTWSSVNMNMLSLSSVRSDNTLWAWGLNAYAGYLGTNDTVTRSSPVQVGSSSIELFASPQEIIGKQPSSVLSTFNGTTDYVLGGTNSQLTLAGDFTIEMYFLNNGVGGATASLLLAKNAAYTSANNFYIAANHNSIAANAGKLSLHKNGLSGYFLMSNVIVTDSKWHHVAITRIGSTVSMYIDGSFQNSITNTDTWDYSTPAIGSNPSDGGATIAQLAFNGYISNLRIVNGIGVYTGNFVPPTSVLTAKQSSGTNISAITNDETALLLFTDGIYSDKSVYNTTIQTFGTGIAMLPASNVKTSIGGGEATTMVVANEGFIWATGLNNLGQLSLGNTLNRSTPVQINVLTLTDSRSSPALIGAGSWSLVTAGQDYSMALNTDGTLWAWGLNTNGALGTGTTVTQRYLRTQIPGSYTWLTSGGSHTVAIKADSTLFAWGLNNAGQIGQSDTISRSSPVQVGTTEWNTVYAGNSHTIALDAANNAYAWGLNTSGQLGDNTVVSRSAPVQVYAAAVNYSLSFNGTNSYVTVPYTASPTPTGDFTVECWFNLSSYLTAYSGNYAAAICSNWAPNGGDGFEFTVYSSNNSSITGLSIYSRNGGAVATWTQAIYAFNLNTWYHVALVKSGTSGKVFINGVLSKAFTFTIWGTNTNPLRIGAMQTTNYEYYFPGYISNFRVTTTAVYTDNFYTPNTNLTVLPNTTVLLGQSSTVKDNSANNYTVTVAGAAAASTQNPFVFYSGLFDGSASYLSMTTTSNLLIGTNDFVIEAWIYIRSRTLYFPIMTQGGSTTTAPNWFFGVTTTGYVYFDMYNGTSTVTTATVPLYKWTHVALVRIGSSLNFYVNGVDSGTTYTNSTNFNDTTKTTRIGRGRDTSTNYADGFITNLRFVVGTGVYTGNFTPSTAILPSTQPSYGATIGAITGNQTKLLTLQNSTLIDNSSYNVSITNNGSMTLSAAYNPFISNTNTVYNAIFAGPLSSYGLLDNSILYAWGNNAQGQIGDGTTVNKSVPSIVGLVYTANPAYSSPVQIGAYANRLWLEVAAGGSHTGAVATDWTVWNWGNNTWGQQGTSTTINKSSPTQLTTNTISITQMSAGYSHGAVVTNLGLIYVGGLNNAGQIGNNTTVNQSTGYAQIFAGTMTSPLIPIKLDSVKTFNFSQVQNGQATTAIKTDGTLWTWGTNTTGQLGTASSSALARSSPVQVGAVLQKTINSPTQLGASWNAVSAGYRHALAIDNTGSAFYWGYSYIGADVSSPVQIGTSSWSFVYAGDDVSLGIYQDSLWSWGINANYKTGIITAALNEVVGSPTQIGTSPTSASVGTTGGGLLSFNSTTLNPPGAPVIGTATVSSSPLTSWSTATITFTAPASNGNSPIISYTVVSNPGSVTKTVYQSGSGSITISGLTASTTYTFTIYATNAAGRGPSSDVSNSITTAAWVDANPGQVMYSTPGTYSWTVPAGVSTISAVGVGGGGGGMEADIYNLPQGSGFYAEGGGGGGLAYRNNISVVPGDIVTIVVGAGGGGRGTSPTVTPYVVQAPNGGNTSITVSGVSTIATGGPGGRGVFNSQPPALAGGGPAGTYDGGGYGSGLAGGASGASGSGYCGGGGAAAGYSGTSRLAPMGTNSPGLSGNSANGDTGGAGTGGTYVYSTTWAINGKTQNLIMGQGGGGVGLLGKGTSGGAAAYTAGGLAGSSGTDGTASAGTNGGAAGVYGGGGGGASGGGAGGNGAGGAVRIIWPGNTRQYPSTGTADQ